MTGLWSVLNSLHLLEADRSFFWFEFLLWFGQFFWRCPQLQLSKNTSCRRWWWCSNLHILKVTNIPGVCFSFCQTSLLSLESCPMFENNVEVGYICWQESQHIQNTGICCLTVNMHMTRATSLEFWFWGWLAGKGKVVFKNSRNYQD